MASPAPTCRLAGRRPGPPRRLRPGKPCQRLKALPAEAGPQGAPPLPGTPGPSWSELRPDPRRAASVPAHPKQFPGRRLLGADPARRVTLRPGRKCGRRRPSRSRCGGPGCGAARCGRDGDSAGRPPASRLLAQPALPGAVAAAAAADGRRRQGESRPAALRELLPRLPPAGSRHLLRAPSLSQPRPASPGRAAPAAPARHLPAPTSRPPPRPPPALTAHSSFPLRYPPAPPGRCPQPGQQPLHLPGISLPGP